MNINYIVTTNVSKVNHPTVTHFRPVQGTQSINTVFFRDSFSLNGISPQYQTYTVQSTQNYRFPWEYRQPFGCVARISMSEMFLSVIDRYRHIPDDADIEYREIIEERLNILQAFHGRILKVMQSDENTQNSIDSPDDIPKLTDDEVIDSIIAHYIKEPIGHEDFYWMLHELSKTGLVEKKETNLLRFAGHVGIRGEENRLWQEFIEFEKKPENRHLSYPDLLKRFLEELEKHYSENASQRIQIDNYESDNIETPIGELSSN